MPVMTSRTAGVETHAITAWINFLVSFQQRMGFLPPSTLPIVFFDRTRDLIAEGIAKPVMVDPEAPEGAESQPVALLDYKGQRKAPPESLVFQLELAEQITKLMGICYSLQEGHEADTLLGSVVLSHARHHQSIGTPSNCFVLSMDKDMLQLVNDSGFNRVECIHPQNGGLFKRMTPTEVKTKMGVEPKYIADLLAMMGDTCDNIPGIPGVGAKTAIKLIETYDGLDGIVANLSQISGKLGEKLREHAPYIPALRQLVTFKEYPVHIRTPQQKSESLRSLLEHMDMWKTLHKLNLVPKAP